MKHRPGENTGDLLAAHRRLVISVVNDVLRRYPSGGDREEAIAAGTEGLLQAVRSFDPDRGAAFTTFAYYRIKGAVIDNLRALGKMRRTYQERAAFEAGANALLEQESVTIREAGGTATVESVAGALDGLAAVFMVSLDQTQLAANQPSPEEAAELSELRPALRRGMKYLTKRERLLLTSHYGLGHSLAKIASKLGISRSWACRIHAGAIKKLRPYVLPPPKTPGRAKKSASP